MGRLAQNELLRVVFPPLVLIVAVLGSILGGITNPTPAAALGAAGAIMLAAYRKLKEEERQVQDRDLGELRARGHDPAGRELSTCASPVNRSL
jgi:TRAP-type C4-dicarboxylate transport system permease large subunit